MALGSGTRRRRCVVLADGSAVGCYARARHETHTVVVEPSGLAYSYISPGGALTRHLTPTALSSHRALVRDAVALRNRFAWLTAAPHAQPYLHLALADGGDVRYQRRLRSRRARWPGSGAFRTSALINARDGSLELQSIEGLARVKLHGSGLLADLFFLAELATQDEQLEDAAFAHYATVRQTVAVDSVPEQFALPVDVLLRAKVALDSGHEMFDFELDESRHSVMSALPESSALAGRPEFSVIAPQALAAATGADHGISLPDILRVATMPSRQFYRRVVVEVQEDDATFFMPTTGCSRILVHSARDDSVLSCRGEFFKWIDASGRRLQQFTMETIPPAAFITEAGSSATLLSQCRHTQFLFQAFKDANRVEALPRSENPEDSDADACSAVVEEVENEHGRFRAFRDGRVRVVFADRTILQVQQPGDKCTFFFPDGSSGESTLGSAPLRQRMYIHRALEFADWAFASLEERMERFRRRQHVQEVSQQELKRISVRFGLNSEEDGVDASVPHERRAVDVEAAASDLSLEVLRQVQSETLRHMAAVDQALQSARAVADAAH